VESSSEDESSSDEDTTMFIKTFKKFVKRMISTKEKKGRGHAMSVDKPTISLRIAQKRRKEGLQEGQVQ
jgi:hypothetical protein